MSVVYEIRGAEMPLCKIIIKIKGLLMSDDIEITKYDNFKFNQIIQKQGLNSNKSNYKSKQKKSVHQQINLPNRIIYTTSASIDELKELNPIYKYNFENKRDEILTKLPKKQLNYHLSFNPHTEITEDRLKDTFNFIKNKYGYFLYGNNWMKYLNLDYDLYIEKQNNYHLHLIIRNMMPDDFLLLYGYFFRLLQSQYQETTAYCKLIDDENLTIKYNIKNNNTSIYDAKYFIKNKD